MKYFNGNFNFLIVQCREKCNMIQIRNFLIGFMKCVNNAITAQLNKFYHLWEI